MARNTKPIPKNASEITRERLNPYLASQDGLPISETIFSKHENRGTDYSMKNDTVKDVSIGLQDIDEAILFYFNEILKPNVVQDNNQMTVRTIFSSPERWKSIQQDGFYRDNNNQITVPLIVLKRNNITKNRTMANKIDGNFAALYQVVGTHYNPRNVYDQFDVINNRIPSQQYYVTTVPDYVDVTYDCIMFTNFVEHNNKLIEAIEFASDSYWGNPNRWKFRASIESFATTVAVENGADRAAKSTCSIKMSGYLIPQMVSKDLAGVRNKFYTKSQVIFGLETTGSI
jgi:hypothetical protein